MCLSLNTSVYTRALSVKTGREKQAFFTYIKHFFMGVSVCIMLLVFILSIEIRDTITFLSCFFINIVNLVKFYDAVAGIMGCCRMPAKF